MQDARIPDNEAGRIAVLRSLDILDTPSEDRFDQFTRITARIFDMPIALISLVDSDRQWFKSAEGLDVAETPRNISLCGHAILGEGVFEVRDAQRDPRFCDNPLVVESPHIRFYAGAPLKAPGGHKLGTLCIIDREPRQLSDGDKAKLQILAEMVAGEMTRDMGLVGDLPDTGPRTVSAAEFFDGVPTQSGCSVLLFDIDDVLTSNIDETSRLSPGAVFSRLLHEHFPTATSIAHIGNYHYCVLLDTENAFDEIRAISRLCSEARNQLYFAEGHDSLTPFVGRIQYRSDKYASVDDMRREANRMFDSHEKQPALDESGIRVFLKEMVGWRKTIF